MSSTLARLERTPDAVLFPRIAARAARMVRMDLAVYATTLTAALVLVRVVEMKLLGW